VSTADRKPLPDSAAPRDRDPGPAHAEASDLDAAARTSASPDLTRHGAPASGAMRDEVILRLQRERGNSYVQRLVAARTASPSPSQPATEPPQAGADDALAQRIQSASGSGATLAPSIRHTLETGLGADLSAVQLHTDPEADSLARSVDAVAFTTGSDIFFRANAYNPASPSGLHVLAHEAAHTVQQSSGAVAGAPASGGIRLSAPDDGFERGADAAAQRILAGDTHVSVAPGAPGSSGSASSLQRVQIQRYQAGDTGHGGIEARALTSPDVGMTSDQASQVYFGNWLRDLSQLPPKALPLINVLALGEFNREVTQADLGTYVPSEHLDNPEGGGTVEDPRIQALEHSTNPAERAQFEAALAKLSPEQRAAYDQEQAHRAEITEAARTSGLPEYIEVGKFHAKQTLIQAIGAGATPGGRELMGNALHAIEDYYSHSNFVEACIFMLYRSGAAVGPLVDRMAQTELGSNAALAGGLDATGNPQIVTGTYAPGANDWVSRFELIKTEIEHGQLTRAFALGWLRQQGMQGAELGKRLGGGVLGGVGGVVGAVAGGAVGAVGGAAAGAAQGWATHSGLSAVGHAITGFFSGGAEGLASGGSAGYREGEAEGEAIGSSVGGDVGQVVGEVTGTLEEIVAAVGVAALMIALPEIAVALAALVAAAETDVVAEHETKESATQAKDLGLSGPTHSQLAKDAPDNPLFGVSVQLAEAADREIGAAMQAAWSAADPATTPPPPEITDPVTNLVDKFVSAPASDAWWQSIVLAAART